MVTVRQTVHEKLDAKSSDTTISTFLRSNFGPEVASDVIFGLVIGEIGLNVPVKLANSK